MNQAEKWHNRVRALENERKATKREIWFRTVGFTPNRTGLIEMEIKRLEESISLEKAQQWLSEIEVGGLRCSDFQSDGTRVDTTEECAERCRKVIAAHEAEVARLIERRKSVIGR